MRKILSTLCIALAVLWVSVDVHAQSTMEVVKFTRMKNDLTARITHPVRDTDEGRLCALIRVVTNLKDIEFRADALGIVKQEQRKGEVWLYVPYGAKSIAFRHEGYFPVLYQYTDHIDEGTVYELRLKNNPIIDPTLTNNNDNVRNIYLERMDDKDSVFGQFKLFTRPNKKFDVYVDDEAVGVSPYISRRLKPGNHKIRIERKKYYPVDTLLTVEKGIISNVSYKMTSYSDSMYYKCFGRKKFAIGIHASYKIPLSQNINTPISYLPYDEEERIHLKSVFDATFGLFGDFKLGKRFYMILGVDYTYLSYKNIVNSSFDNYISYISPSAVYKGNVQFDYEESYTYHTIEMPVLASLRFAFKNSSSLHINAGPFVNFGLSAKMKLSGTNDIQGNVYPREGFSIGETPVGTFNQTDVCSGDINLYSRSHRFKILSNIEDARSVEEEHIYHHEDSPLRRLNFGLKFGMTYEYKSFQLGVNYKWTSIDVSEEDYTELPASGAPYCNYSSSDIHTHMLEIKLGYVFRHK